MLKRILISLRLLHTVKPCHFFGRGRGTSANRIGFGQIQTHSNEFMRVAQLRWPGSVAGRRKKKSNYDALVNIAAGVLHVMARKAVARWLFYLCRCLLSPTRDPSLLFFATDQPPPRAVSGLPPATRARVRERPSAVVTFANRQQRNCSPEVAHHSDYANDAEGRPRAGGVTGARAGSGRRNKKHPPLCAGNILRANVRANFNNAFCIRGEHVGGTEGSRFPVFKACPNGFITVLQCAWDVLRSRICQ